MSATNSTTNYALPIFIGTDKPAWLVDWNGAMTDIDAAIKGVDTDVQGAITSISGLSSTVASHTSSISTISGQITVITTNLNTATGNINTINSLIGNGTPTTTDHTIIGAINELHANQGDLADLTTPAVSLVAAINAISGGGAVVASAVSYDNAVSGLTATDVQAAIDELAQGSGAPAASAVTYDNTVSGLTATNVQAAIDELAQGTTEANNLDTMVNLASYTGSNTYTTSTDGYVRVACGYQNSNNAGCDILGADGNTTNKFSLFVGGAGAGGVYQALFIRKGMKVNNVTKAGDGSITFFPLV